MAKQGFFHKQTKTSSSDSDRASIESALAVLKVLPVPTLAVDGSGMVVMWNSAMERVSGTSASAAIGKTPARALSKSGPTPLEKTLQRSQPVIEDAFDLVHPTTKSPATYRFEARPFPGGQRSAGAFAILTASEAPAHRSAQGKLDRLAFPVIEMDRDYTLRYVNPAAAAAAGSEAQSMLGKKCYDFFRNPHCETPSCASRWALQSGAQKTADTVVQIGGRPVPIQYTSVPVRGPDGAIDGVMEAIVDTSHLVSGGEANERQKQLEKAKERLASYLDALSIPIIATDGNLTVEYVNRKAAEMLSRTSEECQRLRCHDLLNLRDTNPASWMSATSSDSAFVRESSIRSSRGEVLIEVTSVPFADKQGVTLGALVHVADITKRKKMLSDLTDFSRQISQGDLTVRATGDYPGDFGIIVQQFNDAAHSQHDAVVDLRAGLAQVGDSCRRILDRNQSVARQTAQQGQALGDTSSTLEEISSMTKQTADNTLRASNLAQGTRDSAQGGGRAMGRLNDAMSQIRSAAESTSQIIRDINDIAFQTNLLALNAAVEAARAGDAGRGFAVVAEEVRNLAQRSKDAAKRTESLIKKSVDLATGGVELSSEVDRSLTGILDSVAQVADIVTEIAGASQEQAKGIEQVNRAISQMERATQEASEAAQDSSNAAEELSGQAGALAGVLDAYNVAVDFNQPSVTGPLRSPVIPRADLQRPGASSSPREGAGAREASFGAPLRPSSAKAAIPPALQSSPAPAMSRPPPIPSDDSDNDWVEEDAAAVPATMDAEALIPFDDDRDFRDF